MTLNLLFEINVLMHFKRFPRGKPQRKSIVHARGKQRKSQEIKKGIRGNQRNSQEITGNQRKSKEIKRKSRGNQREIKKKSMRS